MTPSFQLWLGRLPDLYNCVDVDIMENFKSVIVNKVFLLNK